MAFTKEFIKDLTSAHHNIQELYDAYWQEKMGMRNLLRGLLDFPYYIECHPGDHKPRLHHYGSLESVPLRICLDVIKRKGILTEENFFKLARTCG